MGKGVTEIRRPVKETFTGQAGLEKRMQTSLSAITEKAKRDKKYRFRNLYRMLNGGSLIDTWQAMNRRAAAGVDGYTVKDYEANFLENIVDLTKRLKGKRYRAKLVKRVYIPKSNGKMRPLGLPSVEDKLVQGVAARILGSIYEADFHQNSFGYRRNRKAWDALDKIRRYGTFEKINFVVEADIRGFFDNIDHDWLIRMLEERIDDRAFLNLIRKWLKAGILETDGATIHPVKGTPQGGIISPVLANIYLHYALDLWFEKKVRKHCVGKAFLVRYADDFVCLFQYRSDAERFYRVLPKRLGKFGLEIAPEKTHLLSFSKEDLKGCEAFDFLGFEHRWIKGARGQVYMRRRTSRKRLRASIKVMKDWVIENRVLRLKNLFKQLNRKLKGYYNYYGLFGNSKSLIEFYRLIKRILFKWLNRRSQRRSFTWEQFKGVVRYYGLEEPRITEQIARPPARSF